MTTEPQQLIDAALQASTSDGCVVSVAEHSEANLRWAGTTLTTNGQMAGRSVTVVATFARAEGAAAGVVTRAVTDTDDVVELVRAAEAAGRDADAAEDAAPLVEPDGDDAGWDEPPARTGIEVFDDFAGRLGAQFGRWRGRGDLLYGFAEHQLTSHFLGSSTGLRRRVDQPTGRLEINGKSGDLSASTWTGVHTRDFTDIDVDAVAARLEQRLQWSQRRVDLPPGRYDTILPPTAVADFMIYLYWSAAARGADEGRNAFADPAGGTRIGQQLAALPLSLHSDPAEPGLQCPAFVLPGSAESVFDSGYRIGATRWIDGGRLVNLVGTRAWAGRSRTPTRPAVDNLVLDGAPEPVRLDAMVAGMERGLLLTCLWYVREVDPQTLLLTGLTRDGVFLVEDGEVQAAVNNFRFNESPLDLLARAVQAGDAEPTLSREWSDDFTRTRMPALRVPDFHMSTVSRAS